MLAIARADESYNKEMSYNVIDAFYAFYSAEYVHCLCSSSNVLPDTDLTRFFSKQRPLVPTSDRVYSLS